jgi:hypothetical protein
MDADQDHQEDLLENYTERQDARWNHFKETLQVSIPRS